MVVMIALQVLVVEPNHLNQKHQNSSKVSKSDFLRINDQPVSHIYGETHPEFKASVNEVRPLLVHHLFLILLNLFIHPLLSVLNF